MTKKKKIFFISSSLIVSAAIIIVPTSIVFSFENSTRDENNKIASFITNFLQSNINSNRNIKINNNISIFEINNTNFENFLINKPTINEIFRFSKEFPKIPENAEITYNFIRKMPNLVENPSIEIRANINVGTGNTKISKNVNLIINEGFISAEDYLNKISIIYSRASINNQIINKNPFSSVTINQINASNLLDNINGLTKFNDVDIEISNLNKNNNLITFDVTLSINKNIPNFNVVQPVIVHNLHVLYNS